MESAETLRAAESGVCSELTFQGWNPSDPAAVQIWNS